LYHEKRQNSTLLLVAENKSDKQVNKKDLTSDWRVIKHQSIFFKGYMAQEFFLSRFYDALNGGSECGKNRKFVKNKASDR